MRLYLMKIEEQLALNYYESLSTDVKSIIINAFTEGYSQGLTKRRELIIDRTWFYDLGLQSGTLWSEPIRQEHPWSYVTYELASYYDVCDLPLPTLEDVQELISNCRISNDSANVAKNVVIIGPSGERIGVGTQDYRHNDNPNSVMCIRKGKGVNEHENMFWIKSDIVDNCATVATVNFIDKTISLSKYFTGYKLPYILVKK